MSLEKARKFLAQFKEMERDRQIAVATMYICRGQLGWGDEFFDLSKTIQEALFIIMNRIIFPDDAILKATAPEALKAIAMSDDEVNDLMQDFFELTTE